LNEIELVR